MRMATLPLFCSRPKRPIFSLETGSSCPAAVEDMNPEAAFALEHGVHVNIITVGHLIDLSFNSIERKHREVVMMSG